MNIIIAKDKMRRMSMYNIRSKTGLPITNENRKNLKRITGFKSYMGKIASKAFEDGMNTLNARAYNCFQNDSRAKVLDLGTNDGALYLYFNNKIGSTNLYGIDAIKGADKNIKVSISNLEDVFPFKDKQFDVVISSQNIEHIVNTPQYISEIHRVLKKGGYAVILTENITSWVNIFPLFFGWMPFSLTNMFGNAFGNPLVWHSAINKDFDLDKIAKDNCWGIVGHQRVFSVRGLVDLFARYGLSTEKIISGGYFVFGGLMQEILSQIDPIHSHFIGLKFRKNT